MFVILAIVIGILVAAGAYLMLRRSVVQLIFGLILLGHGGNLLIFVAGGLRRGVPALVTDGAANLAPGHADPIPQALVLTAIVIGFAVVAFAAVLVQRVCHTVGSDDLDRMQEETA